MKKENEFYMRIALELAEKALKKGNPPVGALLVFEKQVIGIGVESTKTTGDITNHAEILTIKDAIKRGNSDLISKSSLYTTHEPCVMCSYCIRHYKIPSVFFGLSVQWVGGITSAFKVLTSNVVEFWTFPPKVKGGILEEECLNLSNRYESIK